MRTEPIQRERSLTDTDEDWATDEELFPHVNNAEQKAGRQRYPHELYTKQPFPAEINSAEMGIFGSLFDGRSSSNEESTRSSETHLGPHSQLLGSEEDATDMFVVSDAPSFATSGARSALDVHVCESPSCELCAKKIDSKMSWPTQGLHPSGIGSVATL